MNFLKSKLVWLVLLVVVLGVVWKMDLVPSLTGTGNKYQAVFLSNNQVYFGRLSGLGTSFPVLKEIYYLQVSQVLQPKTPNQPQQQINLVKLGGELHGPEDAMKINREHILFVEDLKMDSQVVNAIKDYLKNQTK